MKTLLATWGVLSIIPTILLIISVLKKNEKQWGLLELWLRIEIALFLMSIPISLIILLFNFLEK